jgi:hypothetical protein
MKKLHFLFLLLVASLLNGYGVSNFTGTGQIDAKTFSG